VLGRRATAVVVCGGAAADGRLPALLAQVLGREVHVADGVSPAAAAGTALVARAVGAHAHLPALPPSRLPAGDAGPWQEPYDRWTRTVTALRRATDDVPDAP
jgi:sugar (pentulose or hexulose) kinase